MRAWWLVVLTLGVAGVATVGADVPPPLPRLAAPGPLFLISTEGGAARCQRWEVVPGAAGDGQLVRAVTVAGEVGTEAISYRSAGATLTLTSRSRTVADQASTTCEVPLTAVARPDAIAVGDSRWFFKAAGCAAALARRARVALDLSGCALEPVVPTTARRASKHAFERLLRRGGVFYIDENDRCAPIRVTPSRQQRAGLVTGSMSRRIVAHGTRGRWRTRYMLVTARDELRMMGHGVTYDDGSGYGIGCLSQTGLWYGHELVYGAGPLYLTRAACRTAVAARLLHDTWVPIPTDADDDDDDADDDADDDDADADAADADADDDERGGEVTRSTVALGGC